MDDPVVVIAAQRELVSYPIEQRHFGIGKVSAYHQYDRVSGNQGVNHSRESEIAIRSASHAYSYDRWEYFENPCEVVVRANCRPYENYEHKKQQNGQPRSIFHLA